MLPDFSNVPCIENILDFVFLECDRVEFAMNIYEIDRQDLGGDRFAYRNITDFREWDSGERPFIFDGFILNVCVKGSAEIRINSKEYRIASNTLFAILPRHVFSFREHSPDLDVRSVFVSLDFICRMPVKPDPGLFMSIDLCPCVKLEDGHLDDMLKIQAVAGQYGCGDRLSGQIRYALTFSLILMAASFFGSGHSGMSGSYSRKENITRNFFDTLLKSHGTEHTVSYFADRLCISPKYLTAVFPFSSVVK